MAGDDTEELAARQHPLVHVVIFTVRRRTAFRQDALNSLGTSLAELLDLTKDESDLSYPFSEEVRDQRQLFQHVFVQLADRRPELRISVLYCSRGDTATLADNLVSRAELVEQNIREQP